MSEEQKGVLVRSVQPISHAHGQLFPGDVLLAFDGVEVASGEAASPCPFPFPQQPALQPCLQPLPPHACHV